MLSMQLRRRSGERIGLRPARPGRKVRRQLRRTLVLLRLQALLAADGAPHPFPPGRPCAADVS